MSEVFTVRAWGGQTTNPPISKYLSKYFREFFFSSHIKLTYNNLYKDFKSIKRPYEVEKFKLNRKVSSRLKIKKRWMSGIRTHYLPRDGLKSDPLSHWSLYKITNGVFLFL